MKKFDKISKSLIHAYNAFVEGDECGSVLKAKYVDRIWKQDWYDSAAMKLGTFFEWHLYKELKVLPDDFPEPSAELMSTGKKKLAAGQPLKIDDYKSEYRNAITNAKRIAPLMIASGIKPIKAQTYITKKIEGRTMHGFEDLECRYKGRKITVDIKYSGLLYNKWEKMGWLFNSEEQKTYHGTQAKHYNLITDKPFYYLVVSPTNLIDVEFFKIQISNFAKEQHRAKALFIAEQMEFLQEIDGFVDLPDFVKCSKCPLQIHNICENALRKLEPKEISLSF